MFERFSEQARQVVVFAQEEARALRHNYIGTEHILLGLLREGEGVAARILMDFAQLEEIRAAALAVAAGRPREERGSRSQLSTLAPEVIEELKLTRAAVGSKKALSLLLVGWMLFALALGAGLLIGWAIWG